MKLKNILLPVLAFISLCLAFMLKAQQNRLDALCAQNKTLQEGINRQIVFERRKIIYKNRSPAKNIVYYIPAEGSAEITEKDGGVVEFKVEDKGFTFKPFIGFGAGTGGAEPFAGARLFYWGRYGLGAAVTPDGFFAAADRKIDDILPFENTSLIVLGGYKKAYLGLAVYL